MDKASVYKIATQVFDDEVSGILQVKSQIDDNFVKAVELIYRCDGKVIVTGMGKSGHIGNKLAATFASTGTAAFFVHPAEALHGDLGMITSTDVVIAISYSGESDELMSILPIIKKRNIPIIAMTGNPKSSLARVALITLNMKVDKEACPLGLAPTTSTTANLVLGDALAISLLTLKGFQKEDFALSHPGGTLGKKLLTTVNDIMHIDGQLPKLKPDASLKDVVMEMSNKGLGLTTIVNDNDELLGIVTDGDLRRVLDHDINLSTTRAVDIMNTSPKVLQDGSLAIEAVDLMELYKINGFVVVNQNKQVVGAFNLHDLLKAKLI